MTERELEAEIVRLNKVVKALMDRAERNENVQGSDFNLFHTAVLLEEQVRLRTDELQAALEENERITRDLRESETRFRALADQSLVGLTLYDGERFSYVNPRFSEMIGYSMEELSRMSVFDLIPATDRERTARIVEKGMSRDFTPGTFKATVLPKDGTVMVAEIAGSAFEIRGRVQLLAVWTDITERLRNEHDVEALTQQLKELSIRDPLTGLFNRRYLDAALQRELDLASRKGHPVCVVMGDIDHFKLVNDTYGHQAGDEVLKAFGAMLVANSRTSDICCRYGGEEFLLLMPDASQEIACQRAEIIRSAIQILEIGTETQPIRITASFGIASFPRHGDDPNQLTSAADAALYEAKATGRNRVVCR
jgi:diguanylate cyclase (GGDEF)-like protein/PAS domain S-box-containing protein